MPLHIVAPRDRSAQQWVHSSIKQKRSHLAFWGMDDKPVACVPRARLQRRSGASAGTTSTPRKGRHGATAGDHSVLSRRPASGIRGSIGLFQELQGTQGLGGALAMYAALPSERLWPSKTCTVFVESSLHVAAKMQQLRGLESRLNWPQAWLARETLRVGAVSLGGGGGWGPACACGKTRDRVWRAGARVRGCEHVSERAAG